MKRLWALVLACAMVVPLGVGAQTPVAESDSLLAGTAVGDLPSCSGEGVCLAQISQSERKDEYYYAVIQNNTATMVLVDEIKVTLRDSSGSPAAAGTAVAVVPKYLAPAGHALVMLTIQGERDPAFTPEAKISFKAVDHATRFGAPLRVSSAKLRGDAIVGEVENQTTESFKDAQIVAVCFGPDGSIIYWASADLQTGPFEPGTVDTFSAAIYGKQDCSQFVAAAARY